MQIKTPNSPKTKYSMKVLKSQSINSNYLSQLEACCALSATNKLCLTVCWLFQSGYKGKCYFGAPHLEGVLVNVFYFQTLPFLPTLLQTWVSGRAWFDPKAGLGFRHCWRAEQPQIPSLSIQHGSSPARLHGGMPLAGGISVFWEGEKGKEEITKQELKTRPAMA